MSDITGTLNVRVLPPMREAFQKSLGWLAYHHIKWGANLALLNVRRCGNFVSGESTAVRSSVTRMTESCGSLEGILYAAKINSGSLQVALDQGYDLEVLKLANEMRSCIAEETEKFLNSPQKLATSNDKQMIAVWSALNGIKDHTKFSLLDSSEEGLLSQKITRLLSRVEQVLGSRQSKNSVSPLLPQ